VRIDVRETGSEPYEGLVVIDAATGFKIAWVIACDDEEGWVIVGRMNEEVGGDAVASRDIDTETGHSKLIRFDRPIKVREKADMTKEEKVGVVNLGLAYD
jgi:hypothetical protein